MVKGTKHLELTINHVLQFTRGYSWIAETVYLKQIFKILYIKVQIYLHQNSFCQKNKHDDMQCRLDCIYMLRYAISG